MWRCCKGEISEKGPCKLHGALLRPIFLPKISLLRFVDTELPGNSLWRWEFHPLKSILCLRQTLWSLSKVRSLKGALQTTWSLAISEGLWELKVCTVLRNLGVPSFAKPNGSRHLDWSRKGRKGLRQVSNRLQTAGLTPTPIRTIKTPSTETTQRQPRKTCFVVLICVLFFTTQENYQPPYLWPRSPSRLPLARREREAAGLRPGGRGAGTERQGINMFGLPQAASERLSWASAGRHAKTHGALQSALCD